MGVRLSKFWKKLFYSAAAMLGLGLLPACQMMYGSPTVIDYPDMYGMPPASCYHIFSGTVTRNGEPVENIKVALKVDGQIVEDTTTAEDGAYELQYLEEAENGREVQLIFDDKITKTATLSDDEYEIIINVELESENSDD